MSARAKGEGARADGPNGVAAAPDGPPEAAVPEIIGGAGSRRRRSRRVLVRVLIGMGVLAVSLLAAFGLAPVRQIDDKASYPVSGIDSIKIHFTREDVNIVTVEAGGEVTLRYHGTSRQDLSLVSAMHGSTLDVGANSLVLVPLTRVRLDIHVPVGSVKAISVQTGAGHISAAARDLESLTVKTTSGGFGASMLAVDKVAVSSTSGAVTIDEVAATELAITGKSSAVTVGQANLGTGKIATSSGRITLENGSGTLDVRSSSGGVVIDHAADPAGWELKAKTSSGSVTLRLPDAAGFVVDVSTSSGKLRSDFGIDIAGDTMQGQVGAGGGSVTVRTTSGSIRMEKRE